MTEEIIEIIANILDLNTGEIDENCDIMEALGADSIDVIEIISEIEDAKGIVFPEDIIPDLRTVSDIVEFTEKAIRSNG